MDIKEKVEEIIAKLKDDEGFLAKFKEDPIKAIEEVVGVDLPDEQLKGIVEGVKAKIALDKDGDGKLDIAEKLGDVVGGLGDKLEIPIKSLGGKLDGLAGKGESLASNLADSAKSLAGGFADKGKSLAGGLADTLAGGLADKSDDPDKLA